jgi:hypothetical protein
MHPPWNLYTCSFLSLPELRSIPVATKGTVIVGVPIGTKEYIQDAIRQTLADRENFKNLLGFHLKNVFIGS